MSAPYALSTVRLRRAGGSCLVVRHGACGDAGARIFCRSLEADLVSIAGNWQVRDDMPDGLIGKPAQISLKDEKLIIEPLP